MGFIKCTFFVGLVGVSHLAMAASTALFVIDEQNVQRITVDPADKFSVVYAEAADWVGKLHFYNHETKVHLELLSDEKIGWVFDTWIINEMLVINYSADPDLHKLVRYNITDLKQGKVTPVTIKSAAAFVPNPYNFNFELLTKDAQLVMVESFRGFSDYEVSLLNINNGVKTPIDSVQNNFLYIADTGFYRNDKPIESENVYYVINNRNTDHSELRSYNLTTGQVSISTLDDTGDGSVRGISFDHYQANPNLAVRRCINGPEYAQSLYDPWTLQEEYLFTETPADYSACISDRARYFIKGGFAFLEVSGPNKLIAYDLATHTSTDLGLSGNYPLVTVKDGSVVLNTQTMTVFDLVNGTNHPMFPVTGLTMTNFAFLKINLDDGFSFGEKLVSNLTPMGFSYQISRVDHATEKVTMLADLPSLNNYANSCTVSGINRNKLICSHAVDVGGVIKTEFVEVQ